jgi:hypothetical protein
MLSFPNRCQYLKVNGTQCGSPALRRNRFCFFHKRHHEERIQLHTDRARRSRRVTVDLPALEDANSVQVSIMQILRLTLSGQLDSKTAGLALYALQIASSNLSRTTFTPFRHDVVLDPRTVDQTALNEYIWEDDDFCTDTDEDEEVDEEALRAQAVEQARRKAADKVRDQGLVKAHADRMAADEARRDAEEARAEAANAARLAAIAQKLEAEREARLEAEHGAGRSSSASPATAPESANVTAPTAAITATGHAVIAPASPHHDPGRRPCANVNMNEVREKIRNQVREALPAIAAALAEKNRTTSG